MVICTENMLLYFPFKYLFYLIFLKFVLTFIIGYFVLFAVNSLYATDQQEHVTFQENLSRKMCQRNIS